MKSYVKNFAKTFSPFKLQNLLSSKDCLTVALKSFVVYRFTCAGCQSCYIRKTKRRLPTRIKNICKLIQNLTFFNTWLGILRAILTLDLSSDKNRKRCSISLVKSSAKQTEESRKYHNFCLKWDIYL